MPIYIENYKLYHGIDVYTALFKYLDCAHTDNINDYEFIELSFNIDGNDYYNKVYDYLNQHVTDISDICGSDLEDAELFILAMNIKNKYPQYKVFFIPETINKCYIRLQYHDVNNTNSQYIGVYIKK